MIDTQNIADFEQGFAAILDALDRLRALAAPVESDGVRGLVEWHDEVKKILSQVPELPDATPLTQFAEDVDRGLSDTDDKANAAQAGAGEKRFPRDDGLLPTLREWVGEITSETGAGVYAVKEKWLTNATTWADKTGGRTVSVFEVNGATGVAVGQIIKVRVRHDTSGTLRYIFAYEAGPFLVTVAKDGGVAGGAAAQCSWTYAVTNLASTLLAAGVTPEQARTDIGAYYYGGEGGRSAYGLAAWVGATLKLLTVFGEVPKTDVCP